MNKSPRKRIKKLVVKRMIMKNSSLMPDFCLLFYDWLFMTKTLFTNKTTTYITTYNIVLINFEIKTNITKNIHLTMKILSMKILSMKIILI